MPASPTPAPQITSAASWAQQEIAGVVTELPSGKVVMLRRTLDLPVMLKSGRIPNPLAQVIQRMISKGQSELPSEDMADPVVFQQMMDMVDTSVAAAMVEPKAVVPPVKGKRSGSGIPFPETDEQFQERWASFEEVVNHPEVHNAVSTDLISIEDKIFIFFFAQGGAADLATFRSATNNALASLSGSEAVEVSSE